MALEKKWAQVSPKLLTSNGTTDGKITVGDPSQLFVKQRVILTSGAAPTLILQIKRIENNTVYLGLEGQDLANRTDVSAYLVSDGSAISALEQVRPAIYENEIIRAVFQEEPIVALRTVQVDPVTGTPLPTQSGSSSVVASIGNTWKKIIDSADSVTTYVGLAVPGSASSSAVWQIKKIRIVATITFIEFADGNLNFDNIWDNRASLSYS